jgi:hypothetical protein
MMLTMRKQKVLAQIDLAPLRALDTELPDNTMGRIRYAWPEIEAALRRGHRLKTIHQRLIGSGIKVGYKMLSVYLCRLRREKGRFRSGTSGATRSDLPRPVPVAVDINPSDPFAAAMAALNQPRYDIRVEMSDGDPTKRNLI